MPAKSDSAVLAAMGVQVKPRSKRRQSIVKTLNKKNFFHASSQDFVKRIYRSEKALKDEQMRQQQTHYFVIHPFSNFR